MTTLNETNSGQEEAENYSTETQRQIITPDQERFYRQSIYTACIDRYFALQGLVCYAEHKHSDNWDFGFRHVASGRPVLVFSRLDDQVFDIVEQTKYAPLVIIDGTSLNVPFTDCECCPGAYYIGDDKYQKAQKLGFYILHGDTMLINMNDYSDSAVVCDECWGERRHHLLEKMRRHLNAIERGDELESICL